MTKMSRDAVVTKLRSISLRELGINRASQVTARLFKDELRLKRPIVKS